MPCDERQQYQDAIEELEGQITRLKASMNQQGNGVKLHRLQVITWLRGKCQKALERMESAA